MREKLQRAIGILAKKRKTWQNITVSLAAVVVFATTYMLILPAITVERDTAPDAGIVLENAENSSAPELEAAASEEAGPEEEAEESLTASQELSEEDSALSGEQTDANEEQMLAEEEPVSENGEEVSGNGNKTDEIKTDEIKESAGEDEELQPDTPEYEAGVLKAEGAGYEVNVSYSADARISPEATLRVEEITAADDEYDAVVAKTEETLSEETNLHVKKARLLDITILDGMREIEPNENVDVKITLFDEELAAEDNLDVFHDHEGEDVQMIKDVDVDTTGEKAVLSFETDGFSTYVIVSSDKTQTVYIESEVYLAGNTGEGARHSWTTSDSSIADFTGATNEAVAKVTIYDEGTVTITHTYQRNVYTFQDKRYETIESKEYFYLEAVPIGGPGGNPAQLLDLSGYLNKSAALNEWQAVDKRYNGNEPANKIYPDVYAESDTQGTTPLGSSDYGSSEPIIRLQKNVIPTGTENEFYVYLSVDKPMSLAELFADAAFTVSTNANRTVGDVYSGLQGNPSIMIDEAAGGVRHVVNYRVWDDVDANGNGYNTDGSTEPRSFFSAVKYGSTPQCRNGVIQLRVPIDSSYKVASNPHWHNDGSKFPCNSTFEGGAWKDYGWLVVASRVSMKIVDNEMVVDIPRGNVLANFDTHLTSLYHDVTDIMGEGIEFLGVEECDGDWTFEDGALTWSPKENQAVRASEKVWPQQQNWYNNVIQMVYKIRLDVSDDKACAATIGSPQQSKAAGDYFPTNVSADVSYVRVNHVEKDPDTGELVYNDPDAKTFWSWFPVPSVRGLLYDVRIDKFDKLTPTKPIEGTSFEIYDTNPSGSAAVSPIGTGTTASDGRLEFTKIPYNTGTNGVYWVKETVPSDGYIPVTSTFPVTLSYTIDKNSLDPDIPDYPDYMVAVLPYGHASKFLNTPICMEIKKVDKETDTAMANVGFKLTMTEKLGDDTYVPDPATDVYTGTTDSNGIIRWERLVPGTYTLEETTVPTGYAKPGNATVEIDGLGNITIKDGNGNISLNGTETVQGVAYAIVKVQNVPIHIAVLKLDPKGQPVTTRDVSFLLDGDNDFTGTTDSQGMIYWDRVSSGDYTLKETQHPTDYKQISDTAVIIGDDGIPAIGSGDSGVSVGADVTHNGKTYHVIQVINKYSYIDVIPRKADIDGSNYLSGATFEITTTDGDPVGTYTTDENGYFVSEAPHTIKLSYTPKGEYYIWEKTAPVGYTLPAGPWKLVVTENGISLYPYNEDSSDPYEVASFTGTPTDNIVEFILNDSAAKTLPKTGGIGTGLYTGFGIALLAVGSALMYINTRRRRAGGDDAR